MRNDGPLSRVLVWYARAPDHPAKLRSLQWLGRHVFPPEGIAAEVLPGVRLLLHPRDWIEYLLLRGDSYEPLTLEFLRRNLNPGQAALLAGINFGLHLIVAARAVGPEGVVIGVEPQPASVLRAAANVSINGVSATARIVEAALGDEPGLVPVGWPPSENSGAATLLTQGAAAFWTPVVRADTLWFLLEGRRCRLALLDVEGYEVRALRGLLESHRPEIVVCELNEDLLERAGMAVADLLGLLKESGYGLFNIVGHPLAEAPEAILENNVVATLKGCPVVWLSTTVRR